MRYACLSAFLLLMLSCDYLNVKKTPSEDILKEELQTFNWKDVDVYPSFSVCDSVTTKLDKKKCFERELTEQLTLHLSDHYFVASQDVRDTLQLTFLISDNGKAIITDIKAKDETLLKLPDLKRILDESTEALSPIFPALKRGQQVTSQFRLPVVISVD